MLTINIPQSNARVSEEDAFAKYILEGIVKDGEKTFFWWGSGWGDSWEDGYSDDVISKRVICSGKAIERVIKQFEARGYSIRHKETIAGGQCITIKG